MTRGRVRKFRSIDLTIERPKPGEDCEWRKLYGSRNPSGIVRRVEWEGRSR